MKREVVTLVGRVQGVGFRDRVLAVARRFAVAGGVYNRRAERALEIDVEGEPDVVDAFVAAVIAERPFFARIDGVARRPAEPRGISGFGRAPTA